MQYDDLRARLIKANDLQRIVEDFAADEESVWHLRKHVLATKFSTKPIDSQTVGLGLKLGLELLSSWSCSYREVISRSNSSLCISQPILIVGSEWLAGTANAPPPEVYICLAKWLGVFHPVTYLGSEERHLDLKRFDPSIELAGMTVEYVPSYEDNGEGSWAISMREGRVEEMTDTPETRARFAHFLTIPTRWMDNDLYGHVNNVVYYSYFDTVINEYLIREGGLDIHNGKVIGVCAESSCKYFASFAFPEPVEAGLRVGHLGNRAVRYEIGLFKQDRVEAAAIGSFVHVFVERGAMKAVAIPDGLRKALEKLVTG